MPFRPTEAMHWYYRVFKPGEENVQLVLDRGAEDWTRLQVWDGTRLQPAMPKGFSGVPDETQINELFALVQKKQLFFFQLGNPVPQLLTATGSVSVPREPKEPAPVPPLTITDPKKEVQQKKDHAEKVKKYHEHMQQYHLAQEVHANHPSFQAAVDQYQASRDLQKENNVLKSRKDSDDYQKMKNSRAKADRVISQMMGPKPTPPPEVFYTDETFSTHAAIHYSHYDNLFEPNGYDLPANSKLDEKDAATINYAMFGVASEMQLFFQEKGDGPVYAKAEARSGFNMLTTALFGYPRICQPFIATTPKAMQMGKASIEAYQAGDASLLGQRLSECVKNIQDLFTGTGETKITESLVAATKLTERLLDLFERKPDIWEATGLKEEDRDYLRGYVQIGKIYDNYADSQIKFSDAKFADAQLSQAEKAEILADAVIRKMVEDQLQHDVDETENSKEHLEAQDEAIRNDQIANSKFYKWEAENRKKYATYAEFSAAQEKQRRLLDVNAHTTAFYAQPCKHPIMMKLAQPGMLERLRQNLMKDPAILAQTDTLTTEFTSSTLNKGKQLDALTPMAAQLVELSQKQAWFDNLKSMLTQNDPNAWLDPTVASDSNRLMISQGNGIFKKMVSVASLLNNDMQRLQDPDESTINLLFENAKKGNLYFYSKDKDMPARLGADDLKPSAQQLEVANVPTPWQRFWNIVTFGLAYAKECNVPDRDPAAYTLIVRARDMHAAPAEAPQQETVSTEQAQPQQEQIQQKQSQSAQIKPWKYQVKDTRNMSNEEFFAFVTAAHNRAQTLSVSKVLHSENCTPEAYYEVLTQKLEGKVAHGIYLKAALENDTGKRNQILEDNKKLYTAMIRGLGDYVFNHTSKENLAEHCRHPKEYSAEYLALTQASDDIFLNGVDSYLAQLNRENAKTAMEQQQDQLTNQATLTNPTPKKQDSTLTRG